MANRERLFSSSSSYYARLNISPWASPQDIRRAYRELSKRYHPDTTELPPAIAIEAFQKLNEAYATLSRPEQRQVYDLQNGYSRFSVIQAPADPSSSLDMNRPYRSRSAYLDPSDRPLSGGELFAVFLLGLTLVGCLLLILLVGISRGEITV